MAVLASSYLANIIETPWLTEKGQLKDNSRVER